MTTVLIMLTIQSALGAFDNFWHHEWTEDLPHRPTARTELALHTVREFLYAVIFTSIAWYRWQGLWGGVLIAILGIEVVVTLADFIVEDRTRKLPALERVLHTILAINIGATMAVWAPELVAWVQSPTGFQPVSYGMWSWPMTLFGVGVFVWSIRDLAAVIRLGVPAWQRNPMRRGRNAAPRTILVTGATGFVGRAVTRALIGRGDLVLALTRDPAKARDLFGPLVEVVDRLDRIEPDRQIDGIVNLAGENLAGGLWTAARKRRFVQSRLDVTGEVVALIERLWTRPRVLISASAIGYYGDRGDESLSETSLSQKIFMSELCRRWEEAALGAASLGVRVCRLRIGFVLGADGGALPPLALATRIFAGAVMGNGRQFVSWIHLTDLVRLILFAIDDKTLTGPVNAVAPAPVRQADLMRGLGRVLRRPILAAIPAPVLRAGLGELSALFLTSQNVVPEAALRAGFAFAHKTLDGALAGLFNAATVRPDGRVAVYVNEHCSVCRAEMGHYRKIDETRRGTIEFIPIDCVAAGLPEYGLAAADLRRRLYARDRRGELVSGIDAFLTLWDELPLYRLLAVLVRLPGLRQASDLLYDGLAVPLLGWWNGRGGAARPARIAS